MVNARMVCGREKEFMNSFKVMRNTVESLLKTSVMVMVLSMMLMEAGTLVSGKITQNMVMESTIMLMDRNSMGNGFKETNKVTESSIFLTETNSAASGRTTKKVAMGFSTSPTATSLSDVGKTTRNSEKAPTITKMVGCSPVPGKMTSSKVRDTTS